MTDTVSSHASVSAGDGAAGGGAIPRKPILNSSLRAWLRDPLLHFLVLGAVLYVAIPREDDLASPVIDVSRADLLEFMQGRARLYDAGKFGEAYDALPPSERALLLRDFVRQEALYREALKSGLDKADPLVRNRMVQQMELLLRDEATNGVSVSDAEVDAYFAAHKLRYSQPPTVSFTHVFIDGQRRGGGGLALARETLRKLQGERVTPGDSIEFGDRFPYQRNYSASTSQALAPEVGEAMARAAFTMPLGEWRGPFESPLGYHLLRVTSRSSRQSPALDSIRQLVADDALQDKRERLGEEAVQRILGSYQVAPEDDLGAMPEPARPGQ